MNAVPTASFAMSKSKIALFYRSDGEVGGSSANTHTHLSNREPGLTYDLEAAYRAMWRAWCAP